jgi:multidrug resistance efflux pump
MTLPDGNTQPHHADDDASTTTPSPPIRTGPAGAEKAPVSPIRLVSPPGAEGFAPQPPQAPSGPPPAAPPPAPKAAEQKRGPWGRISRAGLGLAALLVAGYFVYDRFFALGSTNAVLSATPLALRAPIDGVLTLRDIPPGTLLEQHAEIGALRNDRLDTSRLNDLSGQIINTEQEADLLRQRITNAEQEATETLAQANAFQRAKIEQIQARLDESEARIRAAQARLREAEGIRGRNEQLLRAGVATVAAIEQSQRALSEAKGGLDAALQQRQALRAELDAASQGVFTGETSTNRSASQQRYDMLRAQQRELSAQYADRQARLDALRGQLTFERTQIARRTAAQLAAPVRSRLIRVQAQSGEFVRQGQEVASLIDCTRPLVTAEVSDRIFRSLRLGMPGAFTASGGGDYRGTIVQLDSPLTSQAIGGGYRVSMLVNDRLEGCETGRSGRVSFN